MECDTEKCYQHAILISVGVSLVIGLVYAAMVRWEYYEKVIKPL